MNNRKSKGGRKKNEISNEIIQEADEILQLAFKDVGCVKSKITYNSVIKFNKHIANNPNYIRKNGDYFSFLGDRFWSKSYNDKPYYGRLLIDKFKSTDSIKTGGETFDIDNKDIESLVNRYHNKPEELKKRLINLFSKDRNQILSLKVRNDKLTNKLEDRNKTIKQFEESFATVFWNSTSSYNSLDDVLTLKRCEDSEINEELLNMFNHDKQKMILLFEKHSAIKKTQTIQSTHNVIQNENTTNSNENVLSIQDRLKMLGLSSSTDDGL